MLDMLLLSGSIGSVVTWYNKLQVQGQEMLYSGYLNKWWVCLSDCVAATLDDPWHLLCCQLQTIHGPAQ